MNDNDFREFAQAFEAFGNEFTALVNEYCDRLTALRRPFAVIRSVPAKAFVIPVRVILPSGPLYPTFPTHQERRYGWLAVFLTSFSTAMAAQTLFGTALWGHILPAIYRGVLTGVAAAFFYRLAQRLDIRRYNAAREKILMEFIAAAGQRTAALEELAYKALAVYGQRVLYGAGDYYGRYFGLWLRFCAVAGDTIQDFEESAREQPIAPKTIRAFLPGAFRSGRLEALEECADSVAFAWQQIRAKLWRLELDYQGKPREATTFDLHPAFRRRRLLDLSDRARQKTHLIHNTLRLKP